MESTQQLTARLQGFGTTIFAEMTALAQQHGAINLGQGSPDFAGPASVTEAARRAIADGHNQYAPGPGIPALRQAIADHQQRFYGLDYDVDGEVTVTAGATEAICAALIALCEPGDEVVLFEPYYDSYLASVAMAGAVPKVVTIQWPSLRFDPDELRAAITPRTRLVLVNSPHNPTGAVFADEDLALIAELCVEHDLVAVCDDVYEHLVFSGAHVPLASLPGMRDRTVTIGSAGKTFSVTGWKVGWTCGSPDLTDAIRTAKQFITFTNGTPFQHAIVEALALPDEFYSTLLAEYVARRDRLCAGLTAVGIDIVVPQGTYFVTGDIRPLGYEDGLAFCRDLPERVGVAAIPNQVFYASPDRGRHLVRFAFCKTDAVLDEGIERLGRLTA